MSDCKIFILVSEYIHNKQSNIHNTILDTTNIHEDIYFNQLRYQKLFSRTNMIAIGVDTSVYNNHILAATFATINQNMRLSFFLLLCQAIVLVFCVNFVCTPNPIQLLRYLFSLSREFYLWRQELEFCG